MRGISGMMSLLLCMILCMIRVVVQMRDLHLKLVLPQTLLSPSADGSDET
jgi:hypothetical protein